jgi:chromosome segregation ATPase
VSRRLNKLDRLTAIVEIYDGLEFGVASEAVTELAEALSEAESYRESAMQSADAAVGMHEERQWEERDDEISSANDETENLITRLEDLRDLFERATEEVEAVLKTIETEPEVTETLREHFGHFEAV